MAVITFKISIIGWEKHQQNKKKNHRYFLLENRFFQDDKIASLSAVETRLYLYLLTVAADLNQSSYSLNTNLIPTYFRLRTSSIHDALTKFESLQLLNYEKTASNTIENKTKEDKSKSKTRKKSEVEKSEKALQPASADAEPSKAQIFISKYCALFKNKYGVYPDVKGKSAGIAKRISKDLTEEKINLYLEAFFKMPDAFLHKAKHPLSLFETKFNEILVYANGGSFTSQTQARNLDQSATTIDMLQQIREGKL